MSRHYFDISDNAGLDRDAIGSICHSDIDAGNEAVRAIAGLARDHLYQGDLSSMSVIVRNEDGEKVLAVSLQTTALRQPLSKRRQALDGFSESSPEA
jgi:hypothetical protein